MSERKRSSQDAGKPVVDRALQALANSSELELPNPSIERNLLRRAALELHAPDASASAWRRTARIAAAVLVIVSLAGAGLAATVGLEGLKGWWYSIRVDGEVVHGESVEGAGHRQQSFTTKDGYQVRVLVEHDQLPDDATSTRIAIREEGPGTEGQAIEEEVYERIDGPSHPIFKSGNNYHSQILGDSEPLHTWTDDHGVQRSLHLIDELEDSGPWLATSRADLPSDQSAELIRLLARRIGPEGFVQITELPSGDLEIELDDGHSWAIAFMLPRTPEALASEPKHSVRSTSGRVHVELDAPK